jgi:hypothetical protein
VSVADVRIEPEVKQMEFTNWLERDGTAPRETSDRNRIRAGSKITALVLG